ncbi:MAG: hypothetical protein EXR47_03805 [Dehalococcoidia bacterium]|nr:hypothetical protein [Dehalococcoidia bacterium]
MVDGAVSWLVYGIDQVGAIAAAVMVGPDYPWSAFLALGTISRTPGMVRIPPPDLGQHTEDVLGKLLGMGVEDVAALRKDGVL